MLACAYSGSMMLQGSRIMSAPGIPWSTPPVHISGGRHWKARSLVWNLFLLSGGPEVVWWWLLLRKHHSWALSFTASSVISSLSLIYLVALSLGAILSSCVCFSILIHRVVYPLCVFPLFLKKAEDIIALKLSIIFQKLIYLGSFLECWRSANVTAIPNGFHPPIGKTTNPYQ